LSNYTIANGEVTFTVPNEWQLSITLTDEFGQWWFVDFKDANGKEVGDAMKRRVHQVLEEAFDRCKIEYGLFPMGVTEESLRSLNKKPPLVEAYNILRTALVMVRLTIRPLPSYSFSFHITSFITSIGSYSSILAVY